MPTGYGDPEGEYWRLINGVAMWDVAVERQVQVEGPDASRLVQILTPRNIEKMSVGVGWYVAVCDHRGVLINDPVLLKHSDNKYWFSIADGDLLLWARAIAAERNLDVTITEPDVSPLAIQGPEADKVVAKLLGEEFRDLSHFHFVEASLAGIPLVVARSGWSRQGGFELYLCDGARGAELWQRVKEAGREFGIGPGNPNPAERIESGLLSWGGDTDDSTNPFEVRMDRYVDLDVPDDVVGIQALREIARQGPTRHQLGALLDIDDQLNVGDRQAQVYRNGEAVGNLTASSWSPRLGKNIGLCLINRSCQVDDRVTVRIQDGPEFEAALVNLPFSMG